MWYSRQYKVRQVWYADDLTGAGTLHGLKDLWDKICECGRTYGYTPNAKKTILIVKDKGNLPTANHIFGDTGIEITDKGN